MRFKTISLIFTLICFVFANVDQEVINQTDNNYLAPLYTAKYPELRLNGSYFINLHDNYTTEEHFEFLRRDFQIDAMRDWNLRRYDDKHCESERFCTSIPLYIVNNLTEEFVDIVRKDPGIESVEENAIWQLSEIGMGWTKEMSEEEKEATKEDIRAMLEEAEKQDIALDEAIERGDVKEKQSIVGGD